ncbi:MAG: RimK family protein [Candidatus Hydrogenedentes bacterium]|nr:RimK family protein [Candidatus Hydrogenedentota bacterium]
MSVLIVVNKPRNWPLKISGCEVVAARDYLTDPKYYRLRGARVFNLCRTYRYQSTGYYVSLLATARGHKPLPSIETIQDIKTAAIIRLASDELDELIQNSLKHIHSHEFTLSIYFGRNVAKRYDKLAGYIFRLFQCPLMRANFVHTEDEGWQLRSLRVISANEIPETHHPFVIELATDYFRRYRAGTTWRTQSRYDIAILHSTTESDPPSNERALNKFIKAARELDMDAELLEKDDYGSLPQYDALFIRETTLVDHHTYRWSRRAFAEGMVVIDDPDSIVKCGNKVYLTELLDLHRVRIPKTLIVHKANVEDIIPKIGLPCILKKPDSSFSLGVYKAADEASLHDKVEELLSESDLVLAQEFLPTPYDWRVGILDGKPLYVCRYYMAENHWQIQRTDQVGKKHYGKVDTLPVSEAPAQVVSTALRAAKLIGNGFYGVDLKESGRRTYVIEVNDNPSVEAGFEDRVLKDELYLKVMEVFLRRLEKLTEARPEK